MSANLTVPAASVTETAAEALEAQVGSKPDMDCGSGNVDLVEGTALDCELFDASSGAAFDTTVTITEVDGTNYSVNVQVADAPNSVTPDAADAVAEPNAPSSGDGAYTYDYEVAKVAAFALEPQLGALPTVVCEGDDSNRVLIEDGTAIDCTVIDAKTGQRHEANVTISDVVGSDYVVNVTID